MQLSFLLSFALALTSVLAADDSTYGVGAKAYKDVKQASQNAKLNIILTNDDSWAASNIRAFYYALRTAGHKVSIDFSNLSDVD